MAQQLNRALGITSVLVAVSALADRQRNFLLIPRFTTGYLSALNLQPTLMTGFRTMWNSAKSAGSSRTPRS